MSYRQVFLLLALFFLPAIQGQAQPFFEGAMQFPVLSNPYIDHRGYIFFTGSYAEPADINMNGTIDLEPRGGFDIYLADYTPDGTFNGVQTAGGTAPAYVNGAGVRLVNETGGALFVNDTSGVFLVGSFDAAADFNYDGLDDVVSPAPDTAGIFLAAYGASATLTSVVKLEGLSGFVDDMVYAPTADLLYLTGFVFDAPWDRAGAGHMYVAAVQLDGTVNWIYRTETVENATTGNVEPLALALTSQETPVVSGVFRGDVDFDGDGQLMPVSTASGNFGPQARGFLLQLDDTGAIAWIDYTGGGSLGFSKRTRAGRRRQHLPGRQLWPGLRGV